MASLLPTYVSENRNWIRGSDLTELVYSQRQIPACEYILYSVIGFIVGGILAGAATSASGGNHFSSKKVTEIDLKESAGSDFPTYLIGATIGMLFGVAIGIWRITVYDNKFYNQVAYYRKYRNHDIVAGTDLAMILLDSSQAIREKINHVQIHSTKNNFDKTSTIYKSLMSLYAPPLNTTEAEQTMRETASFERLYNAIKLGKDTDQEAENCKELIGHNAYKMAAASYFTVNFSLDCIDDLRKFARKENLDSLVEACNLQDPSLKRETR